MAAAPPAISLTPVPPSSINMKRSYSGLQQIHDEPAIFVIDDFLPPEACAALIASATPYMKKSGTAFGGADNAANIRTSSTVLLKRERAEVLPVLSRVTGLLGKPASHCEDLQVSRYNPGEFYKTHFDGPGPDENGARRFMACGGQRLATVLVYLNTIPRGGETAFPTLAGGRLRISPERGRALVFFPGREDGTIDTNLMHEALPVVEGPSKYVAQMWVRHGVDAFRLFMNTPDSVSECETRRARR